MHHSAPLKLQPQVQPLACSTGLTKASFLCAVCVIVEQITSVPASYNFLSSRTRWIWNDSVVVAFYPIQIAFAPPDVLIWHGNILCLTSSSCAFTCKLTLWRLQSLYQFLHHTLELWNTFCSTTMCLDDKLFRHSVFHIYFKLPMHHAFQVIMKPGKFSTNITPPPFSFRERL